MNYEFNADVEKNRLYMMMEGFYIEEQLHEAYDMVVKEAEKLQDGYTVISDVSRLRVTTDEASVYIEKMRDYAIKRKTKIIIRVVGNKLSKMQLKDLTDGYLEQIEVSSLEEANDYLDKNNL